MCPKCKKAHAADAACTRSAQELLSSLDEGIRGALTGLQQSNDRLAKMDERLKAVETAQKKRAAGVNLPGVEDEKEEFKFQRFINAIANRRWELAPFEMDVVMQTNKRSGRDLNDDGSTVIEKRDASTDVDTGGGFIVPNQVSNQLIELFRANLVTGTLGVTRMDGLNGGAFTIPKQTGSATVYDVAEAQAITKSQQTYGQVEMRPRELAALTVLSNQLLRRSNPAAEGIIRNDLAKIVDLALDLRILQGGGGTQALGIVNTSGISTRSIGRAPNVDDLYNMVYDVEKNNAANGRLGWAFHPRTWNTLRQLKDAEGRYILTTNGTGSGPQQNPSTSGTLLGYPFATTTQIPITLGAGAASRIYFGNWADEILGMWDSMEFAASNETSDAFQKNQTWIRVLLSYDCLLRHATSFCVDSTIAA